MKMNEWIFECMGVYNQSEYLDHITEDFGVDIEEEEEMVELIQLNCEGYGQRAYHGDLGNLIARRLYDKVIEKAVDELCLEEDKFDYCCNGPLDTDLRYDGEYVYSWADLCKIADEIEETAKAEAV